MNFLSYESEIHFFLAQGAAARLRRDKGNTQLLTPNPACENRARTSEPDARNSRPYTQNSNSNPKFRISKTQTRNPKSKPSNPKPENSILNPDTRNPKPETRKLRPNASRVDAKLLQPFKIHPRTAHPTPHATRHPKTYTRNPIPETLHPKLYPPHLY